MQRLYKTEIWGGGSGWFVNDTSGTGTIRAQWWIPARILGISPVELIKLLKTEFHAVNFKYYEPTHFMFWNFKTAKDATRWSCYINEKAKECNFIC